jgi:lipopolysaccharide transport system ATP-binding protein
LVEIEYVVLQRRPFRIALRLVTAEGAILLSSKDDDDEARLGQDRGPGVYISRCEIPANLLKRGMYFVTVSSSIPRVMVNFVVDNAVSFSVDVAEAILEDNRVGLISPLLPWEIEKVMDLDGGRRSRG